jgi:hypothetical protein
MYFFCVALKKVHCRTSSNRPFRRCPEEGLAVTDVTDI